MARRPKGENFPELGEIEREMSQTRSKGRYRKALKGAIGTVVVVAALAVLIATLLLPVMRVTGTSMQPGFQPGDILVGWKTRDLKRGDVCLFYFNNKLIIKRVIGFGGDKIEIDEEGHVTCNGEQLEENSYISEYALGLCDLNSLSKYRLAPVLFWGTTGTIQLTAGLPISDVSGRRRSSGKYWSEFGQ